MTSVIHCNPIPAVVCLEDAVDCTPAAAIECNPILDNIETYFYYPTVQCVALQRQGALATPVKSYKCCSSDLCNGPGSISRVKLEISAGEIGSTASFLLVTAVVIALAF